MNKERGKNNYWRDYSKVDLSAPYFISPHHWFRWPQRYIYKVTGGGYSHQEGYGGIHPNWTYRATTYNQMHKKGDQRMTVQYVRTEEYIADFEKNNGGWSWWMRRRITDIDIIFEDELLFFDYPLALKKRWGGHTNILLYEGGKLSPFGKVDYEAEVTEYVSEYEVPEQLGLFTNLNQAEEKFINAKDLYPPGCLATKLDLNMKTERGNMLLTMEVWKDIRGCVPVQRTYIGKKLVIEEIAKKWTGNILSGVKK